MEVLTQPPAYGNERKKKMAVDLFHVSHLIKSVGLKKKQHFFSIKFKRKAALEEKKNRET